MSLARHFSIIQIGAPKSGIFEKWQVRHKEFRENLAWAVMVPGDREASSGVLQLLSELEARGIKVSHYSTACW